jgi:hypothetical protein
LKNLDEHIAIEGLDATLLIKAHVDHYRSTIYKLGGTEPLRQRCTNLMDNKRFEAVKAWAGNDEKRSEVVEWAWGPDATGDDFRVFEVKGAMSIEEFESMFAGTAIGSHPDLQGQDALSIAMSRMASEMVATITTAVLERLFSSGDASMSQSDPSALFDDETERSAEAGGNSEHNAESSRHETTHHDAAHRG